MEGNHANKIQSRREGSKVVQLLLRAASQGHVILIPRSCATASGYTAP
jgi:hypothetical protein